MANRIVGFIIETDEIKEGQLHSDREGLLRPNKKDFNYLVFQPAKDSMLQTMRSMQSQQPKKLFRIAFSKRYLNEITQDKIR